VPAESPTVGLGHLQFEALITTARLSANINDFALVALLGLLGLRIFEACGSNIADLGEEHGHRVLRVRGKGGKVVLVLLPPAIARAIDRAVDGRVDGPIMRNTLGGRMDRHAATRRLKHLAATAGIRMPRMHPHMLRHILSALLPCRDSWVGGHMDRYRPPSFLLVAAFQATVDLDGGDSARARTNATRTPSHTATADRRHTYVTTMLDAGVSLRDVQIAARHADPAPPCATTARARTSTATRTTSWPRTWPPEPSRSRNPAAGCEIVRQQTRESGG